MILDHLMMVIISVIIYEVFDMRYLKDCESAQPTKEEFKFDAVVPAGIY